MFWDCSWRQWRCQMTGCRLAGCSTLLGRRPRMPDRVLGTRRSPRAAERSDCRVDTTVYDLYYTTVQHDEDTRWPVCTVWTEYLTHWQPVKVAAQSQHADFIRSPFIRSLSFLLNFTPRLKHVYGYSLLPQTICYPWILLNSWVFNGSLADVFFLLVSLLRPRWFTVIILMNVLYVW